MLSILWLSHVFTRMTQNINLTVYSFLVLSMNLILRREKYILGRIGLYFRGIWGEAELISGFCGARQNTFKELRTFFSDLGRPMYYFKGARTPLGPRLYLLIYKVVNRLYDLVHLN